MSISRALLLQEWINVGLVGTSVRFDENVIAWFQGVVDCRGPETDSGVDVDDIQGSRRWK